MEIKIDTKHDSKEHIQHMIDFLQKCVAVSNSDSSYSVSSSASNGMMDMFGSSEPAASPEPQPSMFGMFNNDSQSQDVSKPDDDMPENSEKIELVPY